MTGAGWTDERIELLKRLWNEGKSASECAKTLGLEFTRNSVVAKVDRLRKAGAELRGKPAVTVRRPAQQPTAPRRQPGRIALSPQVAPAMPAHIKPVAGPPRRQEPEAPGTATLLTLGAHACKWPIGDPADEGFTLCGRDAEGSYCREHAELAYQPSKKSSTAADLERSLRRYL